MKIRRRYLGSREAHSGATLLKGGAAVGPNDLNMSDVKQIEVLC